MISIAVIVSGAAAAERLGVELAVGALNARLSTRGCTPSHRAAVLGARFEALIRAVLMHGCQSLIVVSY
jgi:hypothetical protein